MRTRVVASPLLIVLTLVLATPAVADAEYSRNSRTMENGVAVEVDSSEAQPPTRHISATPASAPVCTYERIPNQPDVDFEKAGAWQPAYDEQHPETAGSWMWKTCVDPTKDVATNTTQRIVWAPKANGGDLAQHAISEALLPEPSIGMSPPLPQGSVVNFPTWLWVDRAAWKTVTADASITDYGVTATATPITVVWDMGDGNKVTCYGPGTAYNTNIPTEGQHSDCTYKYQRSSAHQPNLAYTVKATINWRIEWKASDGTSGNLGYLSRSASTAVPVGEIQVLNKKPKGGWQS